MLTEMLKQHQSGVGVLLYPVKHLHPNNANTVTELSSFLDTANMVAFKEIHLIIKYVLDTRDLGLMIKPIQGSEQSHELFCIRDRNHSRVPDSEKVSLGLFVMHQLV